MRKNIFFMISLAAAFYGCGGGGGGGGSDPAPDTTPPTIISTSPGAAATDIINSIVTITFSETMDSSTVTTDTFTVNTGNTNVAGTISHNGNSYSFVPTTNLSSNTTYTATVTTDVKDSAGNALLPTPPWSFTTGTITGVSFDSTIQSIFIGNCITCHTAGAEASFLPLTNGISYENLINKTATVSSGIRVIPGNSTDSVLYKRVSGTSAGSQMPLNRVPLSLTDQTNIKTWIDEGALNN